MTPVLITQGKRALALPGWRPMSGVRWAWLDWRTGQWQYLSVDKAYPVVTAIPCFDDPATVGCLLALVREAYADPNKLWGGRVEVHQDQHAIFVVVQPYHDTEGALAYRCVASGPTEVEALLNALEAAEAPAASPESR